MEDSKKLSYILPFLAVVLVVIVFAWWFWGGQSDGVEQPTDQGADTSQVEAAEDDTSLEDAFREETTPER